MAGIGLGEMWITWENPHLYSSEYLRESFVRWTSLRSPYCLEDKLENSDSIGIDDNEDGEEHKPSSMMISQRGWEKSADTRTS